MDESLSPPRSRTPKTMTDSSELMTLLVDAAQRGQTDKIRQIVEEHDFDVNTPDREDCSLLQWAALNNHVETMKYLIQKGANVDYVGGELRATPLHWAIFMGNLQAVVCLILSNADPAIVNRDGCTTLHFAAQRGYSHIVSYLLGKGMDIDLKDQFGMTPLMWATKVAAMDPSRLLVNLGADVNAKDRLHGNTPLHWAVMNTNIGVCQFLLQKGADINALNAAGKTPLDFSVTERKNRYVEEVLRNYRQEKGFEGSLLTRSVLRNEKLTKAVFNLVPLTTYFFIGLILTVGMNYFAKFFLIISYLLVVYYGGKKLHFFRFSDQFALAVYLACKICVSATVFFSWLPNVASTWNVIIWLILFSALMYNFCRTWLGDPGFVTATKEDKLKAVVELAEQNQFVVSKFCTTCLVVRPVRSKHCGICGKCVEVMDHHCPFTGNCIGRLNHRFFIGYLFFFTLTGIQAFYLGVSYASEVCRLSSHDFFATVGAALTCSPWTFLTLSVTMVAVLWVGFMCVTQVYQISVMAMTTNERINEHRYSHFHGAQGTRVNPFDKGFLHNCFEFFEVRSWFKMSSKRPAADYEPLVTQNV